MERLNLFNNEENKEAKIINVLFGSDILSESVDIMNVRQLHIILPVYIQV
jgi:superfamily II DNA or RNA helicase